jgi:hypothetical protein
MATIRESISRIRTIYKLVDEDAFITDKQIYRLLSKYAKAVIRRQDNEKKLMQYEGLFEFLLFVELVEVSKIEASCSGIVGKCTILRTRDKLPTLMSGANGPLIRKVFSIDGSFGLEKTTLNQFISIKNSTNYKYNKSKYFWYRDGYLYFPDNEIEAVMIECLPEDTLDGFCTNKELECTPMQDRPFPIPEYLFVEIEQALEQELMITVKLPTSSQNIIR